MTINVNIGEAKTRLSELVVRALEGEEVILQKAGRPVLKLMPLADAAQFEAERVAARRTAGVGAFRTAFSGPDLSLAALKADRDDPLARFRRKFGPAA
jgi:prevent-host-death family protein